MPCVLGAVSMQHHPIRQNLSFGEVVMPVVDAAHAVLQSLTLTAEHTQHLQQAS